MPSCMLRAYTLGSVRSAVLSRILAAAAGGPGASEPVVRSGLVR